MAVDQLSTTFAALADPTRRAILARLASGEATVNELAEQFPVSLRAVSKHLKVLERAGLITRGRLVSPERVREITTEYAGGTDAVFGMPVRRGLGLALGGVGRPLESENLFGMAGSGGTAAYADSGTGLALAVTKNRNSFGDYTTYNKIAGALT